MRDADLGRIPASPGASFAFDRCAMPFKSQAQRRKFAQLLVEGKISNETFEEWNRETGRTKLPERVGRRRAASQTSKASTRRRRTSGSTRRARSGTRARR
jgi:hypothetical protein